MTVTWKLRDGLKWSDGEDLTCDDFKYAWEWVHRPGQRRRRDLGLRGRHRWDCPSATDMVLHFKTVFEGYITMVVAPLPRHYLGRSRSPTRSRARASGRTRSPRCPSSGAFKFESVTPGAELRLATNPNYTSWKTGKPAHLDTLVFKWYGDPDAMIAGFRNGEVDIATDLQDSDMPKVQDLGDQVSSIQSLTYEFLRPNWSDIDAVDTTQGVGGCSKNPAVTDRGNGCPMADPAMREAVAYAVDKNEINAAPARRARPGREHVRQPAGLVLRRPDAGHVRPREGQADPRGRPAGPTATATASARRTASRRRSSCARRRARSARTRSRSSPAWLKDVGIDTVINPVDATIDLRRLQRVHRRHAVRPLARQLRPRGARLHVVDRPAGQLLQLPQQPVQPRSASTTRASTTRRRRGPGRGQEQRRLRR